MGVKISGLTPKAATIADTDLVEVSQSAGGGTYVSRSVTGANIKALVTDANLTTTDITTNDVSTLKHGFAPKLPGNTTTFLRGDGTYATPPSGGLTEFTEAENTATPNATVPVNSLTPVTATTNADFAIVPKGTGAILADIPDNASTGGNKRGAGAVDLQMSRTASSQVASGANSFVAGINSTASGSYSAAIGSSAATNEGAFAAGASTASGQWSVAMGYNNSASNQVSVALGSSNASSGVRAFSCGLSNTASGTASVTMGQSNVSSGQSSIAIGDTLTSSGDYSCALNYGNTANGNFSFVSGVSSTANATTGKRVHGCAGYVLGDAQKGLLTLRRRTTDNTATRLHSSDVNNVVAAHNQLTLPNNSAFRYKGTIIAKQSGSTNVAAWDVDGLIVRGANAAATTLVIDNVNVVDNTPAWGTPDLTADTTIGCLRVDVTGAAATNIMWTCILETTEVIYA